MIANKVYSVSQLSDILKECFNNPVFSSLSVYGEVYTIKRGRFSYIDLGDQGQNEVNSPLLKCAFNLYYGSNLNLDDIKVGDIVEITGSLSYYAHGSSLTLWGKEIKLVQSQEGKTLLEKKKTLEKLDKLGYLDSKRKLKIKKYCSNIAILTAQNGAAYQDILKTLHMRFPCCTTLYPIVVQGEKAAKSIVKQLKRAYLKDYDAIILGRGGGSKTDLSCFDDEEVCLTIAESKIPIITCIGHTIDISIADRVSSLSCITPTEGASYINPSLDETIHNRDNLKAQLKDAYLNNINIKALNLEMLKRNLNSHSPFSYLGKEKNDLEKLKDRLNKSYLNLIEKKKIDAKQNKRQLKNNFILLIKDEMSKLQNISSLLKQNDLTEIEKKGFALILKDNKRITKSSQLKSDDEIILTYSDGRKKAKIK